MVQLYIYLNILTNLLLNLIIQKILYFTYPTNVIIVKPVSFYL
jgi:hypothetical protein